MLLLGESCRGWSWAVGDERGLSAPPVGDEVSLDKKTKGNTDLEDLGDISKASEKVLEEMFLSHAHKILNSFNLTITYDEKDYLSGQ